MVGCIEALGFVIGVDLGREAVACVECEDPRSLEGTAGVDMVQEGTPTRQRMRREPSSSVGGW